MGNVGESSGIIVINNNQRLYPKRKNGGKMDFLHGWGKTGWKTTVFRGLVLRDNRLFDIF